MKPHNYGHFTVNTNTNLIKISDIQSIYNSSEPAAMKKLQNKLNGFVQGEQEFADVVEHDYTLVPVVVCMKYYLTGYLCHQILKRSTRLKCKSSLNCESNFNSEADLTNIKSKGWLTHPNLYLYSLMSAIETEFIKNVNSNTNHFS